MALLRTAKNLKKAAFLKLRDTCIIGVDKESMDIEETRHNLDSLVDCYQECMCAFQAYREDLEYWKCLEKVLALDKEAEILDEGFSRAIDAMESYIEGTVFKHIDSKEKIDNKEEDSSEHDEEEHKLDEAGGGEEEEGAYKPAEQRKSIVEEILSTPEGRRLIADKQYEREKERMIHSLDLLRIKEDDRRKEIARERSKTRDSFHETPKSTGDRNRYSVGGLSFQPGRFSTPEEGKPKWKASGDKSPTRKRRGLEPTQDERREALRDKLSRYLPGNYENRMDMETTINDFEDTIPLNYERMLDRIKPPVFSGDRRQYTDWWATFHEAIDRHPISVTYKFVKLKECLSDVPKRLVEGMGCSAGAYILAKDKLHRKYGGYERELGLRLDEIQKMKPVRENNAYDLEKFLERIEVMVVGLLDSNQEQELGNGTLHRILKKKLNQSTLVGYKRWLDRHGISEGTENLRDFLTEEVGYAVSASEDTMGMTEEKPHASSGGRTSRGSRTMMTTTGTESTSRGKPGYLKCRVCDGEHGLWKCPKFKDMDVQKRWQQAMEHKICFRCLSVTHHSEKCERSRPCGTQGCKLLHHSMLHNPNYKRPNMDSTKVPGAKPAHVEHKPAAERPKPSHTRGNGKDPDETVAKATSLHGHTSLGFVALRTLPVRVTHGNRSVVVNALMDDGSTRSYINRSVVEQLGVSGEPRRLNVNVLNSNTATLDTELVRVRIQSLHGDVDKPLNAYVTDKVTGNLQVINWAEAGRKWPHLDGIHFPQVHRSSRVDILLGLDVHQLHSTEDEIVGPEGAPVARLTPLGWTCVGPVDNVAEGEHNHFTFCQMVDAGLDTLVRRMWQEELHGDLELLTVDEQQAQDIVEASMKYDGQRYEVAIPWKDGRPNKVMNKAMAERRLHSTMTKLKKQPEVAQAYQQVFDTYEKKGYIREVKNVDFEQPQCFLPHFPVLKPGRETTKVRAVFDGAAGPPGGSLNAHILPGPKLQNDLLEVLWRFRRYKVGIVSDISEMYLQIKLKEEDIPYHRFMLYENLDENIKIKIMEFLRNMFGLNSSPYIALKTSKKNADEHSAELPRAAQVVKESTYMDDSMDSVPEVEEAVQLIKDLRRLWAYAGMDAKKWSSNESTALRNVKSEDRATGTVLEEGCSPVFKTLGVSWLAEDDKFTFQVHTIKEKHDWTKRSFLSRMASVFDPLGLAAPTLVIAKICFQDIWASGVDWDDVIPDTLQLTANRWFNELPLLSEVRVPRCMRPHNDVISTQAHVFTDASQKAFGAVLYIRHQYETHDTSVVMAGAKSRVTPLKSVSIPRLELMASMLGLKLMEKVCKVLQIPLTDRYHWSDSMDVLHWARSPSRRFKPFIANRVGEIHRRSEPSRWLYVNTKENPADLVSRGVPAGKLGEATLWWSGPEYLKQDSSAWPVTNIKLDERKLPEAKTDTFCTYLATGDGGSVVSTVSVHRKVGAAILDPLTFSSWIRLTRVTAWVLRFCDNLCKKAKPDRVHTTLTPDEILEAVNLWIRSAQVEHFKKEYDLLAAGKTISGGSKLLALNPHLDEEEILRSNSRLEYAECLAWETRFPVILPRHSWITQLLVRYTHELTGHGGVNATYAKICERYWIPAGREAVRHAIQECRPCRKRHTKPKPVLMAPLPRLRVTPTLQPFDVTSVDYGGPFLTKYGRGKTRNKRYLCLFTCLSVRAVHLEMAYSLDTSGFMNAFAKMTATRGVPSVVVSDNGGNFVGANNEMKELLAQMDTKSVQDKTAHLGIKWKFQPPHAPHFSGVHERLIGSAKRAIYVVLHGADITDEELSTAMKIAEGLINGRPLIYASSDPSDMDVLTPNHFLTGRLGRNFVPESVDTTDHAVRNRWRHVQDLAKSFWRRWEREWLPSLSGRSKWQKQGRDYCVGDVVLTMGTNTPRGQWLMGKIERLYPGEDGCVRAVDIRVKNNVIRRPIVKVALLEPVTDELAAFYKSQK